MFYVSPNGAIKNRLKLFFLVRFLLITGTNYENLFEKLESKDYGHRELCSLFSDDNHLRFCLWIPNKKYFGLRWKRLKSGVLLHFLYVIIYIKF